jgi:hypothetical protein
MKKFESLLKNIVITPRFIDYRNNYAMVLDMSSAKNDDERLMRADCLLVEYTLLESGLVDFPTDHAHDIIYNGKHIDIKVIQRWFNITDRKKPQWFKDKWKAGLLDSFVFYKYDVPPNKPLEVGDVVSFNFHSEQPTEYILKNLNKSQFEGYYVRV